MIFAWVIVFVIALSMIIFEYQSYKRNKSLAELELEQQRLWDHIQKILKERELRSTLNCCKSILMNENKNKGMENGMKENVNLTENVCKYKVWCCDTNNWVTEDVSIGADGKLYFLRNTMQPDGAKYVVCRFTGFCDRYGNEIYEHDIVKDVNSRKLHEVEMMDGKLIYSEYDSTNSTLYSLCTSRASRKNEFIMLVGSVLDYEPNEG